MAKESIRQKLLKTVYPLFIRLTRIVNANSTILENKDQKKSLVPFFNLPVVLNNGQQVNMEHYRGKKLLLVNTASDCGYTGQFSELQQLSDKYKEALQVIGFPANDFKEQEKGSDADIAAFCSLNYGVSFPLARKSSVVKGPEQNLVFAWLSQERQNGWNNHQPDWNFSKYLVSDGVLTHYFAPSISPLSEEVRKAIED
jgi:glutathione peroxidase